MIRIGTAGWDYKDWKGIVYPDPKPRGFDPLHYLTRYVDTIEVNSTYYHPASAKSANAWLERVEPNPRFRFTAKLWKRFTHERKTAWSTEEVDTVKTGFDPLMEGGRLGAVLVQFPWSYKASEENQEWLDDVLRAFESYPLVVEVRHDSWLSAEFLKHLSERGVGFVNIDQPQFSDSIEPTAIATAPVGYIRVHGRNYHDWFRKDASVEKRYDYLYPVNELKPWVERVKEVAAEPETEDVYVVFNNHYKGKAVANALMMQKLVDRRRKPKGPPLLFDAYSELDKLAQPDAATA